MDSLSNFINRKLFTVFLNIDPSDVRNLRDCFEEAFQTHNANMDPERVHKWKLALKDAGQRSGQPLKNGDEVDFIQKIVQQLTKIKIIANAGHTVRIKPRAQAIISALRLSESTGRVKQLLYKLCLIELLQNLTTIVL